MITALVDDVIQTTAELLPGRTPLQVINPVIDQAIAIAALGHLIIAPVLNGTNNSLRCGIKVGPAVDASDPVAGDVQYPRILEEFWGHDT